MITTADFRSRARFLLSPEVFDYFDGAAGQERTARDNEACFQRWWFRRTVLTDVSAPRTETTVLHRVAAAPLLLAPTALQQLAHPAGESATAAAARRAGLPFVMSTLSSTDIAEVVEAGGDVWFQLYLHRDRAITTELVRRAEHAGVRALVLTVDTPAPGRRLRDLRRGFSPPPGVRAVNLEAAVAATRAGSAEASGTADADGSGGGAASSLADLFAVTFEPSLTWRDVDWLLSITALPVVIKGIATASDARRAIDAGALAVIVSNHGGRQLDGDRPTLDCLPEIVDEIGERAEVYLDGGIRSGGDILKAVALGARAVLIGRPYLWGLAVDGENGVLRVLHLLLDELRLDMRLTGLAHTADAGPGLLAPSTPPHPHPAAGPEDHRPGPRGASHPRHTPPTTTHRYDYEETS
ncbi:alpha-hydroxy-acid oxidizing protein [Streptomyces sp. NBC_01231]|nr:alpha-hydroxy-acid oxidizing protein [Streptomyces sp. NBC_01231]